MSPNGKRSIPGKKQSTHTPKRNTYQNKIENINNSPTKALEGSVNSGYSDKKSGSSTYKRLGEAVVQRLYKSFKENHYLDQTTKESLAQELGITFQQVTKWFENVRWSFQNSSRIETSTGRNASLQATDSKAEKEGALGEERDSELVSQEGSGQKKKNPQALKGGSICSNPSEVNLDVDSTATKSPVGSPISHEVQAGNKLKTRKRN